MREEIKSPAVAKVFMRSAHTSTFRAYRNAQQPDLDTFQVVIEETDLWIAAQMNLSTLVADYVRQLRGQIQAYAAIFPDFLTSLTPIQASVNAPVIIQQMCWATSLVNVGPMAAVAGTIAQMVAEHFHVQSPDFLVENGGDTYLYSTKDRYVGILTVPDQALRLCVLVNAQEFPCSFCASSAKIGHSLSFGNADLVVVRAKDASFADAAATALANLLHTAQDIDQILEQAKNWQSLGVDGIFAQCEGKIGVWGQMELEIL